MEKKLKYTHTHTHPKDDDSDISNIFSKMSVIDNEIEIQYFYYKEKYLNVDISIKTNNKSYLRVNLFLQVTLKDIQDFLTNKKNEIKYYNEHDHTENIIYSDNIELDTDGSTTYLLETEEITIKSLMRRIFSKMIESRMNSFYKDCNEGFNYYAENELNDELDIMITEFKKMDFIIDVNKCKDTVQSNLNQLLQLQKKQIKKQKRYSYSDDDDNDDAE